MRLIPLTFIWLLCSTAVHAQKDPTLTEVWSPVPAKVTPGISNSAPPSDAIILFDGKNLSQWQTKDQKKVTWPVDGGAMTVGNGDIQTITGFGDCQLHLEFRTPAEIKGEGQGMGNSGIFLMGRYELQILDSYNGKTYSNGQAGSVYKQHIPLVNATKANGEWQTYDIIFTAPRFKADSSLQSPARLTVLHNGVLVQNNVTLWGSTQYIGIPSYQLHKEKEPLILQDHGDKVSFRNIWIREL